MLLLSIVVIVVLVVYFNRKKKEKHVSLEVKNEVTKSTNKNNPSRSVPLRSIANGNVMPPALDEFEALISYNGGIAQRLTTSQGERFNHKKYRYNKVAENLPFDQNRIKLQKPIDGCDYINACWISSSNEDTTYDEVIYTAHLPYSSIKFAICQEPLSNTMDHHFRMIHENRFDIIVGFTGEAPTVNFKAGNSYQYRDLTLKILNSTQMSDQLTRFEISLMNSSTTGPLVEHRSIFYQFTSLTKNELSSLGEVDELVTAICTIRNEMKSTSTCLKVLVYDPRGGVRESALFIALYEIFELVDESFDANNRLKKSATSMDVFAIVNRLRKDRAKMVEDLFTYNFLFDCINDYGKHRITRNEQVGNASTRNNNIWVDTEENGRTLKAMVDEPNHNVEVEYVMRNPSYEGNYDDHEENIFSEYYDEGITSPRTYENIEEMSEYV